ncbi:Scr1 family TA system antitoxin-like transcriptional regulator [Nocardia sp. NBC_00508]|uniref:Scr1 family TA system antitoxin-like transcriptional regulator n=1 Tax=Nocardia sp. NBC_00508 TaxID=2975992 RepID=UPI002E81E9F1|nr:Scr1 family TA system antitoxin-like transcriptional regulator [Nocardia sp. NBC_00508]WUD68947.1 Scr1 family TA system antitoxin-like transcriptional regulator [Nocardia sp. NBC_00508]
MPAQPAAPSVPRRQVARILSKLHRESGLYIKDVAEQVNLHHATVTKMLKGQPCKLKPIYIDKLCDIYHATPETRANVKTLAAEAESARGWWHAFSDTESTDKLSTYIALEGTASALMMYQSARIPGLLQTEDYARALLRTSPELTPEEVERHVQVRMRRQAVLTESQPRFDAILDENVIRRALGDPQLASGQLRHIIEVSALPNVSIRLVPFDVGIYRGIEAGPFIILEFAETADLEPEPPVVYIEAGVGSALYFEKREQVDRYRHSWGAIEWSALSAAKTRAYLSKIAKELPR